MILRNQLLAALAAATCALAPAAFSQEPPSPPPSAQDQDSADVGEPAPSDQQDLPPTTTDDEQTAPGAATDEAAPVPARRCSQHRRPDRGQEDRAVRGCIRRGADDSAEGCGRAAEREGSAAADKVKATAESDMIAAVERSGLQVPEFNKIVERMASDTEVRSRVAAKLQERGAIKPDAGGEARYRAASQHADR